MSTNVSAGGDQQPLTGYRLKCLASGQTLPDSRSTILLGNSSTRDAALLRTAYFQRQLNPRHTSYGLYRFSDWLPLCRELEGSSAPITYRSRALAQQLGLSRLYVTFSGYWPERGASMLTGTFKECEAFSVCGRIPPDFPATLVVASAGNTARAFIHVCSQNRIPVIVVVPERNLEAIWSPFAVHDSVTLIAVADHADYAQAIELAATIAALDDYVGEGGARNVARRDGMGTTVLSAVTTIGSIPDYYFQAVGSGTGAIAAWEAHQRLVTDGRFGTNPMRLMLSQNAPFLLLYNSWKARSRALLSLDEATEKAQIEQIYATVLSNRTPPWAVKGGLYDALEATDGEMYAVDNRAAHAAAELFEKSEGIDIAPAAAVALASLIEAVDRNDIARDATIMLNVTGGGVRRFRSEHPTQQVIPRFVVPRSQSSKEYIAALLRKR